MNWEHKGKIYKDHYGVWHVRCYNPDCTRLLFLAIGWNQALMIVQIHQRNTSYQVRSRGDTLGI